MDPTTIGTVVATGLVTIAAATIPPLLSHRESRRKDERARLEQVGVLVGEFLVACEQERRSRRRRHSGGSGYSRSAKRQRTVELQARATRIGASDSEAGTKAMALLEHLDADGRETWEELRADLANSVLR